MVVVNSSFFVVSVNNYGCFVIVVVVVDVVAIFVSGLVVYGFIVVVVVLGILFLS